MKGNEKNNETLIALMPILSVKDKRYEAGGGVVDITGDEDPTDEDGDIGMGDSTGVSMSLGEISSGGKKYHESNISDSDNTRDGDTTVGGAIGA
nr:hypothetical protein [Tanacetum cinerariifolium]